MKKERQYVLVDDDATSNIICKLNIKKADPDAAIISFNDPEKALSCIKEKCVPDDRKTCILFLDLNMPSLTGWEFLDDFQKFDPEVQKKFLIYVLTSSIEDFSVERKKYPLISGIFSKPMTSDKLQEIMTCIREKEREERMFI